MPTLTSCVGCAGRATGWTASAQPLDVPAFARTALMPPVHFSRRFREAYSETPYSYLMTLVDDPDAALSFYADNLGLTVCNEVARDGFRWITLVTDSQPEIEIVLSQSHAGRSHEDGDAVAACSPK